MLMSGCPVRGYRSVHVPVELFPSSRPSSERRIGRYKTNSLPVLNTLLCVSFIQLLTTIYSYYSNYCATTVVLGMDVNIFTSISNTYFRDQKLYFQRIPGV